MSAGVYDYETINRGLKRLRGEAPTGVRFESNPSEDGLVRRVFEDIADPPLRHPHSGIPAALGVGEGACAPDGVALRCARHPHPFGRPPQGLPAKYDTSWVASALANSQALKKEN
jgi:hypothetical protein